MKVQLRKIELRDNPQVARIIRTVMPEFGADGPGFAIHDAEVDQMFEHYSQPQAAYFVIEVNGQLVGGGGFAKLAGSDTRICELKKMYFLPIARGRGFGQMVLDACIREAREAGYQTLYLETFHTMHDAIKLYKRNGFEKLPAPLGATGHFGCDNFYGLAL